ncbi:MAG TPA: hypothetical protein VFB59_04905 [Candidatus Saccharimonadales bacterium]|nr:hypothetical protein [Candidatus Saccharimonadales bacterium]
MIRNIETRIVAGLTASVVLLGGCALGDSSEKGVGSGSRPEATSSKEAYCPNSKTSLILVRTGEVARACAAALTMKGKVDDKKPSTFLSDHWITVPSLVPGPGQCVIRPLVEGGYVGMAQVDGGEAMVTTVKEAPSWAGTSDDLMQAVLTENPEIAGTYQAKVNDRTVRVGFLANIAECNPPSPSPMPE